VERKSSYTTLHNTIKKLEVKQISIKKKPQMVNYYLKFTCYEGIPMFCQVQSCKHQ